MFRLWVKLIDDKNHLLKDVVICNDNPDINRTKKIFAAIEEACYQFDLAQPIWLESNIADFQKHSKTRFRSDSFVEQIDFDFMEIQVIEED